MKRLLLAALLTAASVIASGQQRDIFRQLEEHPGYLSGTDYLCPATPVKLTPAPKGYKAFYISHYGRHGARYAWQSDLYDRIHKALSAAEKEGNLTPFGQDYKRRFDRLYPEVRYRVGDLSQRGWDQQQALAARMYANFPGIFSKEAEVHAWTSTSTRCVMTMSSFCLGLKAQNPKIALTEHFGKYYLPAILPMDQSNPFREKDVKETPLRFDETWEQYIRRTVDYRTILTRLFAEVEKTVPADKQWDLVSYLWFFAAGMNSLETDLDFWDLFTDKEKVDLWKVDDFQFYAYAWPTHNGYQPIVDDIIAKADDRITSGRTGADLRFGHDYTILPLMMILDIDGMGHDVENPDDIPVWCQTHRVPMGANVQLVFYRSRKSPRILFKALLNGEEARLPLETENWPYYDWETFKARYARH